MLFATNTLNPVSFVPEDLVTGKLSLIPLLKKTTNIYVNFQYAKTNKKQMNSLTTVPVPSNTPAYIGSNVMGRIPKPTQMPSFQCYQII